MVSQGFTKTDGKEKVERNKVEKSQYRSGSKVAHFRNLLYNEIGKVAEWFNASVLKTDVAERLPRVRLPPLPPKVASLYP